MSPRAAWRLETLGFGEVYDYVGGKADWFAAGLPIEGEAAAVRRLGDVVHRDVPTCELEERVGVVRDRVRQQGWNGCIVANHRHIVFGFLPAEALDGDPSVSVEQAMASGPTTVRPNLSLDQALGMMRDNDVGSIIVTSSDGSLIGIAQRADLEAAVGGRNE